MSNVLDSVGSVATRTSLELLPDGLTDDTHKQLDSVLLENHTPDSEADGNLIMILSHIAREEHKLIDSKFSLPASDPSG
jgi:hypothetical protein